MKKNTMFYLVVSLFIGVNTQIVNATESGWVKAQGMCYMWDYSNRSAAIKQCTDAVEVISGLSNDNVSFQAACKFFSGPQEAIDGGCDVRAVARLDTKVRTFNSSTDSESNSETGNFTCSYEANGVRYYGNGKTQYDAFYEAATKCINAIGSDSCKSQDPKCEIN